MKKISKLELTILIITILIFLGSIIFFAVKIIIENHVPTVYYRTYSKEDGWTKWCKNGEICGSDHYITALQINLKTSKRGFVYTNVMSNNKWQSKDKENNQVIGDKKNPIQSIKIRITDDLFKKYILKYRISDNSKKWNDWADRNLEAYYKILLEGAAPVKYIQIKIDKR
ncbi:MAG: hypothetical protein J6D12_06205 [Peptostreptococcaceae bacterium]|nr:hypothetical protein [Peptostreptococcaceae bacterium]